MGRDTTTSLLARGERWHRQRGLARWLAIGLGSALLLALILAQTVRAAGEGINLGSTTLSVDEGHSTSYSVSLVGDKPEGDVVVDITSSNTDVVPNPTSLTFTSENYRTSQPVTLRVTKDSDSRDEGATITHAINAGQSADSFDDADNKELRVTVIDADDVGATFSSGTGDDAFDPTTAPVEVDEGGTAEYTVALQSAPTQEVTVTITSGNEDAVTVTATLTFTPTDFDADTVTVTGVQDATTNDDTVTITHAFASTDSNYNGLSETVTVTVNDDETAGVTFDPSPLELAIAEGANGTYTVVLDEAPTHAVTVRISSDNPDVTPLGRPRTGSTLTFEPGNYSTPQEVLVEVGSDGDAADETATLTHTVSSQDPNYNSQAIIDAAVAALTEGATDEAKAAAQNALKGTVEVTDVNVGVRFSSNTVKVDEGSTADYTVALQSAPTSNVTVTITSGNTDAVTVTATLTFTPTDFDADTVMVTGVQDATTNDDTVTITHAFASTDSNYNGLSETVTVTVNDDETAGVTFDPSPLELAIAERANGTYTVALDEAPTHAVTVRISSDNPDVTVDETSLTFTPDDFAAKTVMVMIAADADNMDEMATLTHAVSSTDPNYNSAALIKAKVDALADEATDDQKTDDQKTEAENALKGTVEVTDVNVGVRLGTDTVDVDEGGTANYTVALQSAPTHDVTVNISSDNPDVTVDETSLTFTPDNFAAKTVMVTVAKELEAAEDRSDEMATLTHAISSDDLRYSGLSDQAVTVNVTDNDPSLTLSATELDVMEGESGDFTVKLAADPDSDRENEDGVEVKVEVSGSDGVTVEPAELTFTSDNWDEAQTVTVMAVLDEDDRDGTATVTLKALVGTGDDIQVYDAEFTQLVSILLTEPAPEPVTVRVPGQTRTVPETRTRTVTRTVEVPAAPAAPNVIGMTGSATATEVDGRVLITRHDGGPSLVVDIGGFIRDDSFGQTYQVVRRADGMIVRQWVSPNSPLVYQINWAVVNSAFTVPVGVVGAIPLDDQVGAPGQLVRRFDGGDDRIFSYEMGQWRHVPNIPTFQALGFYWCDVTAADSAFFDRISIGAPHPATGMAARGDYPNCSTG